MDYRVWRSSPDGFCGTCILQILVGLQGKNPEALFCQDSDELCCRSSGLGPFPLYPGSPGKFTFHETVTLPPGRYVIRWWMDLKFKCADTAKSVTGTRSEEIGLVVVR